MSKTEEQVRAAAGNLRGQISADQQSLEEQLAAMQGVAVASLEALQVGHRNGWVSHISSYHSGACARGWHAPCRAFMGGDALPLQL